MTRVQLEQEYIIRRELLKRQAQAGCFRAHVAYLNKDYSFNWHHRRIANTIERFLKDPNRKRLAIFMGPQHGKSELTTRLTPTYAFGLNPDLNIALCSYSHDLASGFNRDVQRYMTSDSYKELYPDVKLNEKNVVTTQSWLRNAEEFEIVDRKGKLKAVGVGGGLTGKPVDLGIIDDPVKDYKEANSATIRESIWNWYVSVFLTRLHNNSKQLLIMTRWHSDDLAGRLLKQMAENPDDPESQWEVLNIQTILEEHVTDNDPHLEGDPRELGEVLWPERHKLEKVLNIKKLQSTIFDALYQGRPVKLGGNKVSESDFEYVDTLPPLVEGPYIFVDGAYTEQTKNDATGIMICYYSPWESVLYITRAIHKRQELPALLKTMEDLEKTFIRTPEATYFIEPKASGLSIIQMTNARLGAVPAQKIVSYLVQENKEARLQLFATYLKAKKVKILSLPENQIIVTQTTGYPAVSEDEFVDLCGYACEVLFKPDLNGDRFSPLGIDNIK